MCDETDTCLAFSYSDGGNEPEKSKCLLSGKAISYSDGFTYFEKIGATTSTSTADGEENVAGSRPDNSAAQEVQRAVKVLEKDVRAKTAKDCDEVAAAHKEAADAEQKARDAKTEEVRRLRAAEAKLLRDKADKLQKIKAAENAAIAEAADRSAKEAARSTELDQLQLATASNREKLEAKQKATAAEKAAQKATADAQKTARDEENAETVEAGEAEADQARAAQEIADEAKSNREKEAKIAQEKQQAEAEAARARTDLKAAEEKSEKKRLIDQQRLVAAEAHSKQQEDEDAKREDNLVDQRRQEGFQKEEAAQKKVKDDAASSEALAAVEARAQADTAEKRREQVQKEVNDQAQQNLQRDMVAAEGAAEAESKAVQAEAKTSAIKQLAQINETAALAKGRQEVQLEEMKAKVESQEISRTQGLKEDELKFEAYQNEDVQHKANRAVVKATAQQAAQLEKDSAAKAKADAAALEAKAEEDKLQRAKLQEMLVAKNKADAAVAEEEAAERLKEEREALASLKEKNLRKQKKEEQLAEEKLAAQVETAAIKQKEINEKAAVTALEKAKEARDHAAKVGDTVIYQLKAAVAAFTDSGVGHKDISLDRLKGEVTKLQEELEARMTIAKNANESYTAADDEFQKNMALLAGAYKEMNRNEDQTDKANMARAEKAVQDAQAVLDAGANPQLGVSDDKASALFKRLINARRHLLTDLRRADLRGDVRVAQRRLLQFENNSTKAPTTTPTSKPTKAPTAPTRAPTTRAPTKDPKPEQMHKAAERAVAAAKKLRQTRVLRKDAMNKQAAALQKKMELLLAKQKEKQAQLLTPNTAFGSKGEPIDRILKVQSSDSDDRGIQNTYLKFDVSSKLKAGDSIQHASLSLFKISGEGSRAQVRQIACNWERDTITFTNAADLGGTLASYQESTFSPVNNGRSDLTLQAAVLNTAKNQNKQLCFSISGGPSAGPPDVFASERASENAPTLKMQVHMAGAAAARALAAQKAKDAVAKAQEKEDYRQEAIKELRQQHTKRALDQLKIKEDAEEKTAADSCARRIEIQISGAAKTSLEETQKAATATKLQTQIQSETQKVTDELNEELKMKLQNSGNPEGSPEYNLMQQELQSGLAADIEKVMGPKKAEIEADIEKEVQDVVNTKLEQRASSMKAKCDMDAQERAKGYGKLTAEQEENINASVESDLPARMEDFGKDEASAESQNEASPESQNELGGEQAYVNTAHLNDSVYSSHVQLLDDGDVYYNLLR
jgi:hypothetical protein